MIKTKLYSLLILTTAILLSCNKPGGEPEPNKEDKPSGGDMIWDIGPVEMLFYIKDAQGNNLLNPKVEGNILANKIKVLYDGKEFTKDEGVPKSKVYMPVFNGLTTSKHYDNNVLCFGEFDGAEDHDKSFTIDWGDGTSDKVSFSHRFEWNDDNTPKSTTVVYLNDKIMDRVFTIIK